MMVGYGCSHSTAKLGVEFSLNIGQSTNIEGESLQIRFLDIIGDNRCPRGATCVWQGEVSCAVEITYHESLNSIILTQPGLTDIPSSRIFKEYEITFQVEPYPEVDKTIPKNEYQLVLTVDK
jgi:hypothetical protein